MSRYLVLLSAVLLASGVIGCERSKLQEEMMGDSTWETSAGDEDWSVADKEPSRKERKRREKWEQENAPLEGEAPAEGAVETPAIEEPAPTEPSSRLDQPRERVRQGVIARNELVPVLNRGLGRYLQNVETEPSFHRGAFVGFRIVSLFPGELGYASLDLRPGDTVTRVNGKPIERPEQALALWDALRTASDLVVDYERNGEALQLRFAIVDES